LGIRQTLRVCPTRVEGLFHGLDNFLAEVVVHCVYGDLQLADAGAGAIVVVFNPDVA